MLSNIKTFSQIGILTKSTRYQTHLKKIEEALYSKTSSSSSLNNNHIATSIGLEENYDYQLILQSNDIIKEIDDEMILTTRFISEIYKIKFPELETLITNRIDYIKVIQRIQNHMDLTTISLNDLLSPQLVMIVSVSSSTTSGKPLTSQQLNECLVGCDEVLKLYEDKKLLLQFIESRIGKIAPNLTGLIGAQLTAQLIGLAGGLIPLSKIPGCNVQVLGQEKVSNLMGLSLVSNRPNTGILINCDLISNLPPALKKKGLKMVANKVALVARIDAYQFDKSIALEDDREEEGSQSGSEMEEEEEVEDEDEEDDDGDDNGNKQDKPKRKKPRIYELDLNQAMEGLKFRQQIIKTLEKLQEPSKARTNRALPVPEEKKKTRRGGKRVRKLKERMAMTDIRKQQNRMNMTVDNGEYGDSAMGFDHGTVGNSDGSGKLRAAKKVENKFTSKKLRAVAAASSGQTNGMSSSLVFTPVQGLELVNPNAAAERVKEANKKWFDAHSGFISALPKSSH